MDVVGVVLPRNVAGGQGDNVNTKFARGVTYKIWEGTKCPKFGAILATFDFDRKYLRNGSTY